MRLSDTEIQKRIVRLRNLEYLYTKARERIAILTKENKQLRERILELEDKDKNKGQKIEAMAFQLEQIQNKLFGKKPMVHRVIRKKDKKQRDISSYRRPLPTRITNTEHHHVYDCPHCQGKLRYISTCTFFEEDIPLPINKVVTKHEVEVGYCANCKLQSKGYAIPSKKVVLGNNVRKYICILSIANRLSHTQIQTHLKEVFSLAISVGEIGNMLQEEANNLRPEYEHLKQNILKEDRAHYDETSWSVAKEEQGRYAWVAASTKNHNTVFSLGRSRGKGNVDDIGKTKVGISDDYNAYRNTFDDHQLCFAHPHRKLRDLAESDKLSTEARKYCVHTFHLFGSLYKQIGNHSDNAPSTYLKQKWQKLFDAVSEVHIRDPVPLLKIKESLRKNKEKYFTFLKYPGLPIDNNKAERSLRHLVIKRKISFGSKTQRGAETTSILASVILSMRWNNPENWFTEYLSLRT